MKAAMKSRPEGNSSSTRFPDMPEAINQAPSARALRSSSA